MAESTRRGRTQARETPPPRPAAPGLAAGGAPARRRSTVWGRFRRHKVALVGSVILLTLVVGAVGAPFFARNDPYRVSISAYRKPPRAANPLGTDSSGRDVLSRLLHAGRVSLSVGLVAVSIYPSSASSSAHSPASTAAGSIRSSCAGPTSSLPSRPSS